VNHTLEQDPAMRLPIALLAWSLLADVTYAYAQATRLYPAVEPIRTDYLDVSRLHSVYWEISGNETGIPVIVLHGGPGGRSTPVLRRLFDPGKYRVIQFDQRGAGRSRPFGEWRDNTTQALIEDINRLRDHLGVEGPAVILGLSWGTTLALAYGQAHPDNVSGLVLLGVFTCSDAEIDHYYHGGVAPYYPEAVELLRGVVPEPDQRDYPKQLFEVVTASDSTRAARAARAFITYEEWLSTAGGTQAAAQEEAADSLSRSMAILENYYLANRCFLRPDQLLTDAGLLNGIPTFIANGRLDMITPPVTALNLARRLPAASVEILPANGHVDLGVALAAVRATDSLASLLRRRPSSQPPR
jgi:proline iminopeptidase